MIAAPTTAMNARELPSLEQKPNILLWNVFHWIVFKFTEMFCNFIELFCDYTIPNCSRHWICSLNCSDRSWRIFFECHALCTEKQARASKYNTNLLMPPAAIHTARTLAFSLIIVPKQVGVYDKTVSNLCCICLDAQLCWLAAWYPGKSDDFVHAVCGPGLLWGMPVHIIR